MSWEWLEWLRMIQRSAGLVVVSPWKQTGVGAWGPLHPDAAQLLQALAGLSLCEYLTCRDRCRGAPWEAEEEAGMVGGSQAEGSSPGPQEGGICLTDQVGCRQPLRPGQVPCSSWGLGGRGGVPEEGLCPSLIITPAPAAGYF